MSAELIVHPGTGEVITLDAPDETLANVLDALTDYEFQLAEVRSTIGREMVYRMDRAAKWTLHAGPYKLTSSSPSPTEDWDGAALHSALSVLVDDGKLSIEALDAAVETVISYKPRKAGINALRKLGGEVRIAVDALKRETPKGERRVRVERER